MPGNIKNIIAVIDYIETHLQEKLDLETVAKAARPVRQTNPRNCAFCRI